MAGVKGRSGQGTKAGAGRPRKPRRIDWAKVAIYAQSHAPEPEIRAALEITDDLLGPAELEKFRAIVARGHAQFRIELRRTIHLRSRRTNPKGTDGSVNAQALLARNTLDFDRQVPTQEVPPDLGTSRARLEALLIKAAQQKSSVEGRHVSVLELIHRETQAGDESTPGAEK